MDIYHARARARVCVRGARVRGTILASKKIKKNKYNEYIYIHARVCVCARGMAWYLHGYVSMQDACHIVRAWVGGCVISPMCYER